MKLTFSYLWLFCIAMVALTLFTACDHKELCELHDHIDYSRVRIDVDWTEFLSKETPTGMTVTMYPADKQRLPVSVLTNNIDYAIVNLPAGSYNMLVFNQSPSEFGSLSFEGMDDFSTSRIAGKQITSRWYQSRDYDEIVITEPEWVGMEAQRSILVTEAMVEKTNTILATSRGSRAEGDVLLTTAYPKNIISTLTVIVHIKGIYNLRSARAAINGMAAGYLLGENRPTASKATQLLEKWTITTDAEAPTQGIITGKIATFGLPFGHQELPDENRLNLSLLLVDGTTIKDYSFAIGDKFEYKIDAEANVELSLLLEIYIDESLPDVEPSGGSSSGFDATVDDWGDEEQVDIGM